MHQARIGGNGTPTTKGIVQGANNGQGNGRVVNAGVGGESRLVFVRIHGNITHGTQFGVIVYHRLKPIVLDGKVCVKFLFVRVVMQGNG